MQKFPSSVRDEALAKQTTTTTRKASMDFSGSFFDYFKWSRAQNINPQGPCITELTREEHDKIAGMLCAEKTHA